MIFVITGPSGSGKSTLITCVRESLEGLAFSVSHTTRPPRAAERDGVDYHFVTRRRFESMARAGRFIEWAEVHGHLYGTSRAEVKRKGATGDVLLDIDVQGARHVRAKRPGAVQIFIMPPVFAELRRRLMKRKADDAEAIARRLRDARDEVASFAEFDYVIINDILERAVEELTAVISASRCRPTARAVQIRRILRSFTSRTRSARQGKRSPS